MFAEISPHVELVQILLYLANLQDKTCQYLNNRYYVDSIDEWFGQYRSDEAVMLTRQMITKRYFYHIKPLRAIFQLESILSDAQNEYYEWAVAVKKFTEKTDFDSFFQSQRSFYDEILKRVNNCDLEAWVAFIEKYFRQKPDGFKLIVCPIAGNYGFTLEIENKETSFTVRCMPYCNDNGEYDWDFAAFAKSIAHEYAHCFVNRTVENNQVRLDGHNCFFEKHKNIPRFYNTKYAVINEYFVRAFQIRFMEINNEWFPDFCISEEYRVQKEMFIFLERFIEALKQFEAGEQAFSDYYIEHIDIILECTDAEQFLEVSNE